MMRMMMIMTMMMMMMMMMMMIMTPCVLLQHKEELSSQRKLIEAEAGARMEAALRAKVQEIESRDLIEVS
jgi:hypothetical protein